MKLAIIDFWAGAWQSVPVHRILNALRTHGDVEITHNVKEADLVLASVFGSDKLKVPKHKLVVFTGENREPHSGAACNAGFRITDDPDYFRVPLWFLDEHYPLLNDGVIDKGFHDRKDLIAIMVSNPSCQYRNDVIKAFGDGIISGGRVLNNVGGDPGDKMAFMRRAKFGLAFENEAYPGYCTEKLLQARAAGCIPIYWGDPEVTTDFNNGAFWDATGESVGYTVKSVHNLRSETALVRCALQQPFFQPGAEERVTNTFNNWISRMAAMVK